MAIDSVYPVVVKDEHYESPLDVQTQYIVASNGVFLRRDTPLFTSTVRTDEGIQGLLPEKPQLVLKMPRLPAVLLERAMGFFRAAYERWESEAILILFYAPPAHGEGWRFALGCPPQVIPGRLEQGRFRADLRLDYAGCPRPPEFLKLGSFHSHACVGPGHSSIDEHDEVHEAGLHLTAGYVDSARPEFSAAFVANGTRFSVSPDDVLPPFRKVRRFPPVWLTQVTAACSTWSTGTTAWPRRTAPGHGIGWGGNGGYGNGSSRR